MNINEAWILLQNKMQNGAKDTAVSRIEWKHKNSDLWLGLNMSGQPFLAIESSNTTFENTLDLQKFISFDLSIVERFSKKFIEIKLKSRKRRGHL